MDNNDLRWLYRDQDDAEPTRMLPSADRPGGYPEPHVDPRLTRSGRLPRLSQPDSGDAAGGGRGRGTGGQSRPFTDAGAVPPSAPARVRRRRRRRRPLLKVVSTLVLLWVLFLVGTPIFAWTQISTLDGANSSLADQPGTAVLLVGSDARDDLSPEDQRRLGTGSTQGRRTDSMMLLYTAPDGRSVILGLPRDSFVQIPGKGKNKLNAAYAFGGPPLLIDSVEHATGIKVDGYLEVGMLGLVDMVDAVGGIQVCPKEAINDSDAHLTINAGCQNVDGVTALGYARMRKSDKRGDLGRMERQREVLGQIVKQTIHPLSLINPVRYWNLNMGAAQTLRRTKDTGVPTMFGAGVGLISGWTGRGITMTVPIANTDARTKAGSSVIWDEKASNAVFDAIRRGDVAALEQYQ